ncbi:MAG TPA: peptide chain release factor 1 [Actinomycetota bacterium]|nr:peptide chain release factor 1 [Actinomycetota bacterium]
MFERLEELDARYEEVQRKLSDPALNTDPKQLRELGKQSAELGEIVLPFRRLRAAEAELASAKELLNVEQEPAMRELIEQEIQAQRAIVEELEVSIKALLIPHDPRDDKDVIVEIKAGEGGDESALFAGDLFRMYGRYAERKGWKLEVLSSDPSSIGGFKDVTFAIKGKSAYSRMKHEAGVHRVQRVPETESQGRIHTSAAGVLVSPEAEEVEVEIDQKEIQIDVYRSSGPGGQSVNTTDSAVRITHLPTGLVVTCQDEKSQLQNREKAMRILRSRLLQAEIDRQNAEQAAERKSQVKTGDRSEKVRTYNYPQNRVTDHRVKVSVHNLPAVMDGALDEFIEVLIAQERAEILSEDQ